MHILFLAPRLPLPADTGGKIRTYNLLKQIAKAHKVHLVCFSFEAEDERYATEMEGLGIKITLVPAKDPGVLKKILQVIFNLQPVSIAKYNSKEMKQVLIKLKSKYQFDAVHIDHVHMAHYQKYFQNIPCVLDEHNVEYKILERCADVETSLIKRNMFRQQAGKMKKFERQSVDRMSAFLAVSEEDKALLDQLNGRSDRGYVIPNGVDTEYFRNTGAQEHMTQEDAVVFTGSMDWFPNADSVLYFVKDIFPLIWGKKPAVKFYIVGKGPSDELKQYAKQDDRIIVTGRVDDVRVYVERSKVFVVPLRIGGGTRLKILEAMSMQKAVVSTSIGAEGIEYREDHNIVLADEPAEFSEKVLTLLDDSHKRGNLGNAGRMLVLEKYDWNIIGKRLVDIYEKITEKK